MADIDPIPNSETTNLEAQLKQLAELLNIRDRLSSKDAERLQQEKSYSELVRKTTEDLDIAVDLMVGLTGEQRKQGREALQHMHSEEKKLELASKYFESVADLSVIQEQELKRMQIAIQYAGERLGLEQKVIAGVKERALVETRIADLKKQAGPWIEVGRQILNTVDINFQAEMAAARSRAFALMRGANVGAAEGGPGGFLSRRGTAQEGADSLFGSAGSAIGPLQRLEAYSRILTEAPKAAEGATKGMRDLMGSLSYFGLTVDEIISALIKGSREAGMSASDVGQAYRASGTLSKNLGLSTKETGAGLLDMTVALRQVGGTSLQTQNLLKLFSKDIDVLGMSLVGVEKMQLFKKFTEGIAGLPVDKMLGLTMYATGKPLQGIGPGDLAAGNIFVTAKTIFDKISNQVGGGYAEQSVATQKIGQLLGINVSNLKEVSGLRDILKDSSLTQKQLAQKLDSLDSSKVISEGMSSIKNMVNPLTSIDNTAKNILSTLNPLGRAMQELVGVGAAARLAGPVGAAVSTATNIAGTVTALAFQRWMIRTIVTRGALAVGGAAAGIGIAIPLIAWAGYEALHGQNNKE